MVTEVLIVLAAVIVSVELTSEAGMSVDNKVETAFTINITIERIH